MKTISGGALAGGVTPPQRDFNVSAKLPLTKLKNHSARFRAVDGTGVIGATPLITCKSELLSSLSPPPCSFIAKVTHLYFYGVVIYALLCRYVISR